MRESTLQQPQIMYSQIESVFFSSLVYSVAFFGVPLHWWPMPQYSQNAGEKTKNLFLYSIENNNLLLNIESNNCTDNTHTHTRTTLMLLLLLFDIARLL